MKTLSEQIQRLRDVLVTCYNAIQRKGGTIPEAGERNMTNLPAAVASIPQTHGVLTDLEVTANGVYVPEEGADGFSKVTANFDTSSLPKVKVSEFAVGDDCINEEGRWEAEDLIDTSKCGHFQSSFKNNQKIVSLNASNWSTSYANNVRWMFMGCKNLEEINATGWDMSKVSGNATGFQSMFENTPKLKKIIGINTWLPNTTLATYDSFFAYSAIEELDLSGYNGIAYSTAKMFYKCDKLHTLNISDLDTSSCVSFSSSFDRCSNLKELDLTKWNAHNVTSWVAMFYGCANLLSLVGGKTLDEVIINNVKCLDGIKVSNTNVTFGYATNIDTASLRAIINGLADVTDQPAESRPTLTLGTTLMAKLETENPDSITIATEKGWNLA